MAMGKRSSWWILIGLVAGLLTSMVCRGLIPANEHGSILSTNHVPEVFGLLVLFLTARARIVGMVLAVPGLIATFWYAAGALPL